MLAFYKKMLYGLLRFTHMTGVTVSNFDLEKFVASVQDVMVYFKLKHRKLYAFCEYFSLNVVNVKVFPSLCRMSGKVFTPVSYHCL